MAAAYAALVSLMNVLSRIQYSCPVYFDQSQIQSLFDQVNSLVYFLEAYSQIVSNDLAEKMVATAFAAEDTIESYIVDRITPCESSDITRNILRRLIESTNVPLLTCCWSCWITTESTFESDEGSTIEVDEGYAMLCDNLLRAHQEMNLILQEAIEVKEKNGGNDQLPRSVVPIGLSVPSGETIKTVGFDEQVNHLIGQLTRRESSRQILPVVGMGGIGKTTLAKSICKYPGLKNHFDIIAWVTVSQVFTVATIIRPLLSNIGENVHVEDEQLGDKLHKCLFGRSYLIILDDIWDIKVWDAINRFLPDNNNGSRILLTTRLFDVARSVGSFYSYEVKVLDDDKSWDLLSKKVFGQEGCPPELEECGKRIAKGCKGLPLALIVIGGLLETSHVTSGYWEDVAENISSIISGEDNEQCLEILSWSYHQLPIHLKPCFLYMATYPEDHPIKVSDIIMLWATDGLLKPNADKLPEEIAKEYLNALIDRNLITVSKLDDYGRMESLTMHDLVRELSIREAQTGRFVHVNGASLETIENQRRLVVHDDREFSLLGKASARSLICFNNLYWRAEVSCSRLLRVLFAPFIQNAPEDTVQLVNLRFIRFTIYDFPVWIFSSLISLYWNLETLIVDVFTVKEITLPCDIWKLRHIKHLDFTRAVIMPEPPTCEFVLENLETLKQVQDLSDKVLNSIPNIKHLKINNRRAGNRVPIPNMVQCRKLERLEISAPTINLETRMFPDSIRELSLFHCEIPWGSMTLVGSLPNLEILFIGAFSFSGEEWITSEGEFQSLRYLGIGCNCLVSWRTEECSHFPSLEHLELLLMSELEEIPEVFGESMTLKSMRLYLCGDSVVRSANRVVEEQQSNGNHEFTLEVEVREDY